MPEIFSRAGMQESDPQNIREVVSENSFVKTNVLILKAVIQKNRLSSNLKSLKHCGLVSVMIYWFMQRPASRKADRSFAAD